ncbi:stage V sporulation protein D [Clostridium sp. LIBA-8841]|uniref:stage V sporulation protein D n=1 Tax=Clostridium sp. LIBA-8841 TaxID=2987530 RepID=UPI002AC4F91C|nr:stage V sporulation protein D [Clostridium sp. LIBA-8841]MDZ5252807.1 stage V sporulation protein D [Clostridium sp. LIBA-8841]
MKNKKKNKGFKDYKITKSLTNRRSYWIMLVIWGLLAVLVLRLSYIMIFKHKEYGTMAEEQWKNEVKIAAKRGDILDRNGGQLAVSANVYRVDLDLKTLKEIAFKNDDTDDEKKAKLNKIAEELGTALDMPKEDVYDKLNTTLPSGVPATSATLVRKIEKDKADKVKALKIKGVIVSQDTKRYYPDNNFLAQVLGRVDQDGVGQGGIEREYNAELSGIPGMRISEVARNSNGIPYSNAEFAAPVDGKDVTLTIDETIQYFAEKVAEKGMKEYQAEGVSIIVMNPQNGEVLAMANKPDYNPNNPYEGYKNFPGDNETQKTENMWKNSAVSNTFEPGSIFKMVTSAAAVQEGIAGGDETYYCPGGKNVSGTYIKCWKPEGHGTETFDQILENSCNVGFMDIGEKLGKEKLNEYIQKFGFGKATGIDLPGETSGIVLPNDKIGPVELATISFGQTDSASGVQLMAAMNTIANGGTWIQPHVMKEISHEDKDGTRVVDETFEPKKVQNVIDQKTARRVAEALERTVHYGSPKRAYIEGYEIAGKTGTAEKVKEGGGYGAGYVASFAGFAPYDNPQISVLISVDNPKGEYFGGLVAAPLAHDLFSEIFNYMQLDTSNLDKNKTKEVVIPEVRGMSLDKAKAILDQNNIKYSIEDGGSSIVDMNPKPGYTIKEGSEIKLYTKTTSNYNKDVVVPDFNGLSMEQTKEILDKIGLKGTFEGEGNVKEQSIAQGDVVKSGTTIQFKLAKK